MLRILELRRARGWTQKQLSQKSGVSRSYISELERNGHEATVDIICKLCKGFKLTPNDIIQEKFWR